MRNKTTSGLFIFLASMLLTALLSARTPLDADMWWHIRSGEMTLLNGAPLLEDVFSFTRMGTSWTNHSWLSQVILHLAYHLGGFTGLAVYTAVLAITSMALVYRLIEGPPLLKAFLIILCSAACALVWSPRPQMFSLVLFALLFNLLTDYRKHHHGPLWVIPILFAVWSNLHGGFPIGLALLAVFTISEAANRVFIYDPEECLPWNEIGKLALWSLTSIPAILLNPNGINTWFIPFETVGITALQNLIQEWASPDFHSLPQQMILWMLYLMVISFSMSGKRSRMGDILIPLAFGYLTFLARRNITAFAMTVIPSTSRGLLAAWETWRQKAEMEGGFEILLKRRRLSLPKIQNRQASPAVARVINLVIIGLLGLAAFGRLGIMSLNPIVERQLIRDYPVEAANWLDENSISGRILNEYNWGGYLVYSQPDSLVFVDGRTDLFGDEIISAWQGIVLGTTDWRSALDQWDIEIVLLQPDRPVLALMDENGWKRVFEDEKSVLMIRE